MRTIVFLTWAWCAPCLLTALAADSLTDSLQQGLLEEEVNRDLNAAVKAYENAVRQAEAQRQAGATAVFRLAESYRKLGRTNDAVAQYRRVVTDFADQALLVGLSRTNLALLAPDSSGPGSTAPSVDPAELESLREEVKLADQELVNTRKKFENGKADAIEVRRVQREVLQLQRRLPENASPERRIALIQEEIKLSEENLAEVRKKIEVGTAAPLDEISARRELLAVQRELAAARRAPADSGVLTAGSGPGPATGEEANEIRRLQAIIKDSPDLANARNATTDGGTPFHNAASKGYVSVVEYLLANKVDVNATDNRGRTPLHLAALAGHRRLCELLLTKGADVKAADVTGHTPLHLATSRGYQAVVETLLANGAQVNTTAATKRSPDHKPINDSTPLHSAADNGFPALVELLLKHGAEPNARDSDGLTPLIRAVVATQPATTRLLLEKGVDANARRGGGDYTALAYAVTLRNATLVQVLLDGGADLELRVGAEAEEFGWTVLFFPVGNGEVAMTRLLLDRGAEVNAPAKTGITPVHWAVIQNASTTLKLLLERKADVNVRDNGGNTPLHYALEGGNLPIIEALLAAGADPNAAGWSGGDEKSLPPLLRAVTSDPRSGPATIAEALLKHGAEVNGKTPNGWTPLHQAVQFDRGDLVEFFVGNKAEVNARGSRPKGGAILGERRPASAINAASPGGPRNLPGRQPGLPPPGLAGVPGAQTGVPVPGYSAQDLLTADKEVTPLHVAVASLNLELARFLLEHGADVNARDAEARAPLHFAIQTRDLTLIRLLLDAKADPDAKDSAGRTPLQWAADLPANALLRQIPGGSGRWVRPAGAKDIIGLLREHGAREPPEPQAAKSIFETDPEKAKAGGQVAFFGAVRGNGLRGNMLELPAGGGPVSLSQALLQVGFADNARMSSVKLTRVNPETKQPETRTLNLLGLKRGEPVEEILLQDGDRVEVPKLDP